MHFRNLPPLVWLGLAVMLCGILLPLAGVFSFAIGLGFVVAGIALAYVGYSQHKRA